MHINLSTTIKYLYEADERSITKIADILNILSDIPRMNLYIIRTKFTTPEKYEASSKYINNKTAKLKACFKFLDIHIIEIDDMNTLKTAFDTILSDEFCVGYIIQEPFEVPDDLKEVYTQLRFDFEHNSKLIEEYINKSSDKIFINKDIDQTAFISKLNRMNHPDSLHAYPVTTRSCINLINEFKLDRNSHIVVFGRSEIVTKPLIDYLIFKGYTVSNINSKTPEDIKKSLVSSADCIILATGKYGVLNTWGYGLQPNVYIIDVGINIHPETHKLVGDMAYNKLSSEINDSLKTTMGRLQYLNTKETPVAYTPVPGGVGKLTSIGFSLSVALNIQALYYKKCLKIKN